MTRLFLAVWPDEPAIQHVRAVVQATADRWHGVRWTPERNWHVTLRFLGEADPDQITAALTGRNWPTVVAEIGVTPEPLDTHSLVIPVGGVDELARDVAEAAGAPLGEFHGHLTVGRRIRNQTMQGPRPAPASASPLVFAVSSLALVASTLTAQGPVYETVASFVIDDAGGEH